MEAFPVTVVIPVHNGEKTIERAVRSVLDQKGIRASVVVVDDGSHDGTARLVEAMASHDARVRMVRHDKNRGRLEARRSGANAVESPYLMFLDCDDQLKEDAIAQLLDAAEGCDIVQCSIEVRYQSPVSPQEQRFNRDFNRAPVGVFKGDDIVHLVFRDRRTTWSLCGKLLATPLVQRAFALVPEAAVDRAEDACIFFIVAILAQSYRGLGSYEGYVYHIDRGTSDARCLKMDWERFRSECDLVRAADLIEACGEVLGPDGRFAPDARRVRGEFALSVADKLMNCMEPKQGGAALDRFLATWPMPNAMGALAQAGQSAPAACVRLVAGATSLDCPAHPVRTVAAYHHTMGMGGAERVAASLVEIWCAMGLRVVLFSDESPWECSWPLPQDVVWVQLPATDESAGAGYGARARAIQRAVKEHDIDAVVYHQWWNPLLAWDLLSFKAAGASVVAFIHSIFMALFTEGRPREYAVPQLLRHCDGIVTLTNADMRFWRQFNGRVWRTNNPVTVVPREKGRSPLRGKNVLWVGRLAAFDKQPQEALHIMAQVVAVDPQATLTLVGPADRLADLHALEALAHQLGIAQNVEFAGSQDNVAPFYRGAAVQLITSRYDGWCLALAESGAYGLPCVMYEMGYLPLVQDNGGVVAVPQGDRSQAARALLRLLEDDAERRHRGQAAFDHALAMEGFDFHGFWTEVFGELEKGSLARQGFDKEDQQWDLLMEGLCAGLEKASEPPFFPFVAKKGRNFARRAWARLRSLPPFSGK